MCLFSETLLCFVPSSVLRYPFQGKGYLSSLGVASGPARALFLACLEVASQALFWFLLSSVTQLVTAVFRALAEHHSLVTPHIPGVFTSGVGGFYALPPLISIIRLSRYWESLAPEGHRLSGAVP